MSKGKLTIFISLFFLLVALGIGQDTESKVEPLRTADPSFQPEINKPAYPHGEGPLVLIDEAHNNFHTAVGTYKPFATLIERDGYVVRRMKDRIDVIKIHVVFIRDLPVIS
jgi:hypothetical protein